MTTKAFRGVIPAYLTLPAEHTDAAIIVHIDVSEDGQVTAPGLTTVQAALARGCVDLVRQYCGLWTRWLARAEQQAVTS